MKQKCKFLALFIDSITLALIAIKSHVWLK